jgi:formate transporter
MPYGADFGPWPDPPLIGDGAVVHADQELQVENGLDALLPPAMARKAEDVGVQKAAMPFPRLVVLSVLAGAFIGLGACLSTVASTGAEDSLGYGPARVLSGVVFSLGLVLVVVGGAELFTGNNLLVMAAVARRITPREVARNWVIVYAGNLAGAVATAWLVYLSGQYRSGSGAIGVSTMDTAAAKATLPFDEALVRGMLANALVCLAVWLCMSARTLTDKVVAVVFPVTAFVAAGFEHSIANMYFLPVGLFVKSGASDGFWAASGTTSGAYDELTWRAFAVDNLVPVTIGNVLGGAVMVGAVYALAYHAPRASAPEQP